MENGPTSVEEVYRSSRKDCLKHALALDALGIPYVIQHIAGEYRILVQAEHAERARGEIIAYAEENRAPQLQALPLPQREDGWSGVFAFVSVLLIGFMLQSNRNFGREWFEAGMSSANLIRNGEVWRSVTALTLHADLGHMTANIIVGGLIGLFAGQLLGSGLAWLSILLAGAGGNLINAWIRHAEHTSIGASTAVFAALGIVAAYSWIRGAPTRRSKIARYAPIVGAVVLLSYLGTGGERTDVLAHVTGFFTGLLVGAVLGKLGDKTPTGERAQTMFALAAVGIIVLAWLAAMTKGGAS